VSVDRIVIAHAPDRLAREPGPLLDLEHVGQRRLTRAETVLLRNQLHTWLAATVDRLPTGGDCLGHTSCPGAQAVDFPLRCELCGAPVPY
jgi:hypothetical protein